MGENTWKHGWWTIHSIYEENCCGGDFIRASKDLCKGIVGINASQLYPFSMCQAMTTNFFPRTCCAKHRKQDRQESGVSAAQKWFAWVGKIIAVKTHNETNLNLAERVEKNNAWRQWWWPMCKYREILDEVLKIT